MSLDFIAGCIGGCAGVIVGHPLDTVKVQLQIQDLRRPLYRGTWHCFSSIIKNESIRGLFKGITSPLGGVALVNAIVFGTYGKLQRMIGSDSPASHLFAGMGAGLMQSFIVGPVELAKTRLQVQNTKVYSGCFDCLRGVMQREGLRGVYKGLLLTKLREGPAYGVYFCTYDLMTRSEKNPSTPRVLFAGGMAGVMSWLVVYPVDVIKSRYQVDGISGNPRYKGSFDCAAKSLKSDGYNIIFRGLSTTLIRSFPVNAVTFTTFTWIMQYGDKINQKPPKPEPQRTSQTFLGLEIPSWHYYEDRSVM